MGRKAAPALLNPLTFSCNRHPTHPNVTARNPMNPRNANHNPWLPNPLMSTPKGSAITTETNIALRISRARVAPMNKPSSK